jgi:hypothetical protein
MSSENFIDTFGQFYFPIGLEVANTALLSGVVYLVYVGIEIRHPVYAILFANLVITLVHICIVLLNVWSIFCSCFLFH